MKKILTICFFIFIVQAAKSQDIIIMRNGDEVKAKVLEVTVDVIKYKKEDNPDGPAYSVSKSGVFMIKYANGSKDVFTEEKPKAAADSASKKKTCPRYANITQIGFAGGVGGMEVTIYDPYGYGPYNYSVQNDLNIVRLSTVNAVQVNEYFSVGIGVGLNYYFADGGHAVTLPFYLDLRSNILGNKISPVVFFDAGFSAKISDAESMDGLMLEPGVGLNIPSKGAGFNISLSYIMQKLSFPDYGYGISTGEDYYLKFVSVKFGVSF